MLTAYRALELTAQIWLRASQGIETGDVILEKIPEVTRAELERLHEDNGRIKIGLLKAWDLTAKFSDDPLGQSFLEQRARLLDFLRVRNESLFAHGFRPVSNSDYQKHIPPVMEFLRGCISIAITSRRLQRTVVLEQLPTNFLEE